MTIDVVKAGLATSVQDLGRPGYYHLGIPESGAMDRYALRAANLLVGNAEGDAALEATFQGPELRFSQDAIVAVTGAEMPPKVDGESRPTWTSFAVKAGQVLSFDFLRRGARAYIAVSGGIDVPVVLGSRSTYSLGALGGFEGRPLRPGDRLPVKAAQPAAQQDRVVPDVLRLAAPTAPVLRVVPGLYDFRVTKEALEGFFAETWKVATEADRIGYRFRGGRPLAFNPREQPFGAGSDPSNIVDSCYPYGSIQVPGGTEPIVLHRDAVSGGGYFMIGAVISSDMDLIGQMQPNTSVRFLRVSLQEALAARQKAAERLQELRKIFC